MVQEWRQRRKEAQQIVPGELRDWKRHLEEPQVPKACTDANAQRQNWCQVRTSADPVAEFDGHAMDNEADNTDITEGYANPDFTKPEEIVEEPQEAGEVQTECNFHVIVTGSRNEDIGEDVFHCVYYCSPSFIVCF